MVAQRLRWKAEGKKVVFTNGCYDILHPGHVRLLESARSLGDVLILALNTDSSVQRLKGPARPMLSEAQRAAMAMQLEAVDAVTFFDEDTPRELIAVVLPDFLVKGPTGRISSRGAKRWKRRAAKCWRCRWSRDIRRRIWWGRSLSATKPSPIGVLLEVAETQAYRRLREGLQEGERYAAGGLSLAGKALLAALLWKETKQPVLLVADGNKQAEALLEAVDTFLQLLCPAMRWRGAS